MHMSPLREPRIDNVMIRRGSGTNRSSMTKSPIDPPINVIAKIKTLIIHDWLH
jgi:hypothetical protein